ncbi:Isochorismatase hydrolase [Coniophora puteana RWD-64-598 SS2]|uniref:Isochorismatase hydrolase n=1 Tax=Coniophora puteana (strain RWD-64-598) TaxID=741705 RepID=A0A5M3MV47_CONPW|nr:Isochorismatase hydrolase [Coniophora puteana RWD-64-598 SS2]EIW82471.1 Isochorismatase hydrolase [Coniophora puteana RWD-64-598 SS2]
MSNLVRLIPSQTIFFLCDIQSRFKDAIHAFPEVVAISNKMLKFAKVFGIPVIVTEQHPKGLGNTTPEIDLKSLGSLHLATVEKTVFSMLTPEVKVLLDSRKDVRSIVLFGVESHICVLQSALDLLQAGYNVHVLADGVSSCNKEEVPIALSRISQAGGHITTSESAAFQLQRDASTSTFKAFSNIIKEEKGATIQALEKLASYRSNL